MLNVVFQKFCVVCDAPGDWICAACEPRFPLIRGGYCSVCGVPFQNSKLTHPCFQCASKAPAYSKHRAPFAYQGAVEDLVKSFKYKGDFWVRDFYREHIQKFVPDFAAVDAVLPIPLHDEKLRERGFNQSQLLAEVWQKVLAKPLWTDVLQRVEDGPSQVGLGRVQRLKSLKSAFAVANPERLQAQTVLLVDDVHTTGSTLHAASEKLLQSGARAVLATSFAIVPEER